MLSVAFCATGATPRAIISGYIVNGRGTPVSAASIMAVHVSTGPPWASSAGDGSPHIIAATRSDGEGYFEFYLRPADCSRVNCLFFDYAGKSGVTLAVHRSEPIRLVLR